MCVVVVVAVVVVVVASLSMRISTQPVARMGHEKASMQNCSCMVIDGDYDDDKAMVMTDIVTIMTVVAKLLELRAPSVGFRVGVLVAH